MQHFIVATAGHVDHGKSALVQALTGTDPDRLPEEKARGITIDLGFAHLVLNSCSLGLIDVPGHEDFVKNMVAGVGSIDLALFVVAADDGWMPQSEEHLQILSYLGVRHAVVALTKIDLVEGREAETVAAVRGALRDSPFENAPIVGTSVLNGRGLDELRGALSATLAGVPPPRDIGKPRLPVDRVFTLRGIGTVVTGTLVGGVLRRNQAVEIRPSGVTTRIRSLQSHNRDAESTGPGTRAALNLPDLSPAAGSDAGIARGEIVTLAGLGEAADAIDVVLEKSARLLRGKSAGARPLKDGTLVRIHHGSANVAARVLLLDSAPLEAGGRALAQLRFEQPVFVLGGDRFIVRDWAEQATLGGGLVLDPDAARPAFRSAAQRLLLEQRAEAPGEARVWVATQLARDRAVARVGLLLKSRFSAEDIESAVRHLTEARRVVQAGDWVLDAAWWQEMGHRAGSAIEAAHREHPEKPGLELTELRSRLEGLLPALFGLLLAELCATDFAPVGTALRHRSHRPALPPKLQSAGARVRAVLAAKPIEPPAKKELAPDALAQQALRFLLDTGEATEVSAELAMQTESFEKARAAIVNFIKTRGTATASELRQLLNTNRRVIIPLLEKLDRDGVTRRQGDARVLRE